MVQAMGRCFGAVVVAVGALTSGTMPGREPYPDTFRSIRDRSPRGGAPPL